MLFSDRIGLLLINKFPYYRKLLPHQQAAFRRRLLHFMEHKEFSSRKDLQLTFEMKVLISAAAVQVTFGLDNYMLDTFSKIIVYPGEYYSRITNSYHKGDVNLAGIIALSWKDFLEGYNDPGDNRNLGLHEMGHAIRFDAFSGEHDEFFSAYFMKWTRIARDEYDKARDRAHPIFRDYAGSNMNEFLSVCIEHFFETPEEFRKELPELYKHTCILLNQDPTRGGMGIGIRVELLNVSMHKRQGPPVMVAESGNSGGPVVFSVASTLILLLFISQLAQGDFHPPLAFFTAMIPVVGIIISYQTKRLNITHHSCTIVHWPGISLIPAKVLPFEHLLSMEVTDESTFTLHYLWKGKPREMQFTLPGEYELNYLKDLMDEKKVRVREYKAKRPASGTLRR